ncbi:MAG: hypothetical protein K9I37_01760 [Crocinitomicaceae bacterium]|nr:hypothetical protein [Crocinitomicaceae bacterium]
MVNNRFLLLISFLFLIVAESSAQLFRVELKNRTDLYFIDAKKNSLLIFDDSTHYTQIDLTTGATKVLPYYRDAYDIFSEFVKGYKIITDEQNHVYFVDRGCGIVYKWQHDSIIRIDRSFHHKNQFHGDVFLHNGSPYIFGGYGYFLYKNMITSFDFSTKEWHKVTTIGNQIPSADLNRYATKLKDKLNFIVFKPNYTGDSTQVFSFDLNKLKWSAIGTLNLKVRFSDFFDKTEPSPFLVMNRFFYYLDYENNKITKYLLPQNLQIRTILEVKNKIIAFSYSPNSSGYKVLVYNKPDFFKNKVESRPLLVPIVAPFNYSRLTSIIIGFLVLLLIYLIIWKRKKRTAKPKELILYEFKKVEVELLALWLSKPDLKIEMNEINDFVAHDKPSIDTLKKRRETLLKGLKQALDFYLKNELGEEKAISECLHPQDSRMKILMLHEKVALALKHNKIGEKA